MKIALGLFAINTTFGYLLSVPESIRGLLFGLSLFFMVIGLLSEKSYSKFRARQSGKFSYLKRMVRLN